MIDPNDLLAFLKRVNCYSSAQKALIQPFIEVEMRKANANKQGQVLNINAVCERILSMIRNHANDLSDEAIKDYIAYCIKQLKYKK